MSDSQQRTRFLSEEHHFILEEIVLNRFVKKNSVRTVFGTASPISILKLSRHNGLPPWTDDRLTWSYLDSLRRLVLYWRVC